MRKFFAICFYIALALCLYSSKPTIIQYTGFFDILSSITLSHEDHSNAELKYILHEFSPNSVPCEGDFIPQCRDLVYPHMICSLGYLVNENKCESMFKDFPNGQPKNSTAGYSGWNCVNGYTKKAKVSLKK